jgi:hypothetical protein
LEARVLKHESGETPNETSELSHLVTVPESQQYKAPPDKLAMMFSVQIHGIDSASFSRNRHLISKKSDTHPDQSLLS